MSPSTQDRDILCRLAEELAEQAALPVHAQRAELWRKLNDLEPTRPMVWINEIPWNELNVNDELTIQCKDEFCRDLERDIRRTLYQWRHFPGDMILEPFLGCGKVWESTGFGLETREETLVSDETSDVMAHRFLPQIVEPKDVEKIQTPRVTYKAEATEAKHQRMCDLFGDILPVRLATRWWNGSGTFYWFDPADKVFQWVGLQQAMMDLVMRPEMIHEAMRRTTDGFLAELDQMEALGLLPDTNGPYRVGSGGYAHTSQLPGRSSDGQPVRAMDSWGSGVAQIFSEISPEMHWEFSLQYELRWLERWGMTYYGCCEPLHKKIGLLQKIPNLRKISMSPWVKDEDAAKEIGRDYVYSLKPNPAILAEDRWRPEQARKELRDRLDATRGCNVEIILKDISTVRYQPQRLWEWAAMAIEEAER